MLRPASKRAFTLIELLTVIAIIAILAAIIIPTVGGARNSAIRAKTKAQFGQWAAAMELYRQEYGFYPAITSGGKVDTTKFAPELSGRTLAGTSVNENTAYGNRKGLNFYALAIGDLDADGTTLVDAFGNTEIGVRVDTNRDGIINSADTGSWTTVTGLAGESYAPTELEGAVPTNGVRARIVFYSAGLGRDPSDLILSWQ